MSFSIDALIVQAKSSRLEQGERLALAVRLAEEVATLLYLSHTLLGAIPGAEAFATRLLQDDLHTQEAVTNVYSVATRLLHADAQDPQDADAPTIPDLVAVPVTQAEHGSRHGPGHAPIRWA